jgi:translation initiation factor 2B subunit (eIF-2B alpha/beta/delta family)
MTDHEPTDVVTVFLRNGGEVLLLRRSAEVGSYPGRWGGVAGHVEREAATTGGGEGSERSAGRSATCERGGPDGAAREEVREETGIAPETLDLARRGEPFPVLDGEYAWHVHPYLFDCPSREVTPNYETAEFEWVPPTEILRRHTVPKLWTSYERVRPTPETVATDTEHGAAYLSLRALECLRDEAALAGECGGDWAGVAAVAHELLAARPSMAVVANRVNRAMHEASEDRSPAAVELAAVEGHRRARAADAAAASPESDWERVLTLSRSGTVEETLLAAPALERVFVAESRPAREGVDVAERLAEEHDVTVHTDAAVAHVLATRDVDAVVVGADAVLADGSVVNKTGTRAAALAAARECVPTRVVCAADKVTPDEEPHLESGPPGEVYDGDADVEVLNPTFDVTPPGLVSAVRTERGTLDVEGIRAVAREHAALADWDARTR